MQKMLIVSIGYDDKWYLTKTDGLEELNDYLSAGWKVVNMKESGTIDKDLCVLHVCYVVIEK
ncbi:MAG: hypothetical protein K2J36_11280 [Ruminococcus sp.]|nr:hypothetical protein [Ruminococcus sp.]MDE6798574.1 hypothetical protein [Ruminococcus sp.]